MRVSRLVAVLGCVVVAGCAAGPAGAPTAGTPATASASSGSASPTTAATTTASSTTTPAPTTLVPTAPAPTAPAPSTPAPTSPAPTTPADGPTSVPPTVRPTCTGRGGIAPHGARLKAPVTVTGAWICRGTAPSVATPAQARALAAALAEPTPARRRVVCADNIRFDPPTWYLTTATGQVIRPAAPTDSCGQPIQAVQLAVAAIGAR